RRVAARPKRVRELVVAVERPVGDHQRDVAAAAGQRQRALDVVVDDEHAGEAAPDVAGGQAAAVVVVPLEGGSLGIGAVLRERVGVAAAFAGRDQEPGARIAAGIGGHLAVERLAGRRRPGLAVVGGGGVAAVQVDAELARRGRQLVPEGDAGLRSRRAADRGPREAAPVRPHAGAPAGQDRDPGGPDRDRDVGAGEDPRDRQGGREALPRGGAGPGARAPARPRPRPPAGRGGSAGGRSCPPQRTTRIFPCSQGWTAQTNHRVLPGLAVTSWEKVWPFWSVNQESPSWSKLPLRFQPAWPAWTGL